MFIDHFHLPYRYTGCFLSFFLPQVYTWEWVVTHHVRPTSPEIHCIMVNTGSEENMHRLPDLTEPSTPGEKTQTYNPLKTNMDPEYHKLL